MAINFNEILDLRKKIIENEFSKMNDMQKQAVFCTRGPLLILAGAGSGKTTVLVNRIANILRFGEAYESDRVFGDYSDDEIAQIEAAANGTSALSDELAQKLSVCRVSPWRILAITFTNKAATELKDRICARVGEAGNDIWASTFHSCCARILRRYGDRLGYSNHFAVYDTDDSKRLISDCMKALGIDEKMLPARAVMGEISRAKDEMRSPKDLKESAGSDNRLISVARLYELYQKRLKAADAMDFDDLIYNTVLLFKTCPDILQSYREQFKYIMVDEYQDTNMLQYQLISLLAGEEGNLCVVGDDDQSIYKFRGATIENILSFEHKYKTARVIRLEQNYRSTKNILSAANKVIENNSSRKGKTLWTQNDTGEMIHCYTAYDEQGEASYIAKTISDKVSQGANFSDFSILYRMNSQSQSIERVLVRSGIPYRIIGGHRFYERKEIKDMLAYLSVICNHSDSVRLKRIINVPKRSIGERSVEKIEEIASVLGESMFDVMCRSDEYSALSRSSEKMIEFCKLIDDLTEMLDNKEPLADMYDVLLESIDYITYLEKSSENKDSAIENIQELKSSLAKYEEENGEDATLQGFLEEVALMSDIDNYNSEADSVVLMTLHSAKGLEFPYVFIPGMEDDIFPSYRSTLSEEELQEERRLAYVGITRAKKELYFVNAESRMLFGKTTRNRPSRFIAELPQDIVKFERSNRPQGSMQRQAALSANGYSASRDFATVSQVSKSTEQFRVGDCVKHKVFGTGMILSAVLMGKDIMLEIAFDKAGTKKIMANYTKLVKL